MDQYIVFVKTDDLSRIIAVQSSAFLDSANGWTEIDRGTGDRYHHAQNNYLTKPITDERGIYRYVLRYGQPVERMQAEMDADYIPPVPSADPVERIAALEEQLAATKILLGVK